jgi:tRNA(His) guanylyltransferase
MHPDDFESKMRRYESFHGLTVLAGAYPIIRVDGRAFHTHTEKLGFTRPFDRFFHECMQQTAEALLNSMEGVYAYTESDEISVVMRPNSDIFGRGVEKLVSTSAATATAVFNSYLGSMGVKHGLTAGQYACTFDSRVITAPNLSVVTDYFAWRQSDSARNCLNAYAFWLQVNQGKTRRSVGKSLEGVPVSEKHEILYRSGINFAELPGWQKNGSGLYSESYKKSVVHPKTGEQIEVNRRRTVRNEDLPTGSDYRGFVSALVGGGVDDNR